MKHCAALAKCCQTLPVAQRSWCGLAVAPPQPRDTKETEVPGTGGWGDGGEHCGQQGGVPRLCWCHCLRSDGLSCPQVKFSMYLRYLRAVGLCFSFCIAMGYVGQYVAYVGTNLWLSAWTDDAQHYLNQTYPTQQRDLRIGVFGALGVSQGEGGRTVVPTHLICVVQEGYNLQGLQPAAQQGAGDPALCSFACCLPSSSWLNCEHTPV